MVKRFGSSIGFSPLSQHRERLLQVATGRVCGLAMRDFSGSLVLYITEQAALKLTNAVDAAEFLQMHSENRLCFPLLSFPEIWRKPKKILPASAVQPGNDAEFDCFIVDAHIAPHVGQLCGHCSAFYT